MRALALIALLAFAAGAGLGGAGVLDGLERPTLEARFDLRGASTPDDVAVVGVDSATLTGLGLQWPFPRSLHGRVIRRLHAAGAREIVYDVQFTEATKPREDLALYDAVGAAGGAVLATSEVGERGATHVLGGDDNLARVNARAGASNLTNDGAGAVTRFPREVAGLDTLAVAAAKRLGAATDPAAFEDGGALIDYRGPAGTVPTLSFADVLRGRFRAAAVRGRVVVVGASTPTLRDIHATPVGDGELMAGAEVQANAIWTALHGYPLRAAPAALGLLLTGLLAFVAPLAARRRGAFGIGAIVFVAAGTYAVAAHVAFEAGWIVDVAAPLTGLLLSGVGTIAWSQLTERRTRVAVARDNELLEARVLERTRELREAQLEVVQRLGAAVEWRDLETKRHVDRIGRFCERLAVVIGMTPAEAETLRHASALHDVGKVGIPDGILSKPGRPDPAEWAVLKTHTTIGASILEGSASPMIQLAHQIALTHHERWDGTGYPRGLAGEDIPLAGRICAICDVFDALLSARPYKSEWPIDEVLEELRRGRGSQFDPRLLDAFLAIARELHGDCEAAGRREAPLPVLV